MVQIQIDISKKADQKLMLYMAKKYIKDKREAINNLLENYNEDI